MVIAGRIEQEVRSGRTFTSTENRGFEGKMKEVDYVEGVIRVRKNQFQNYHTSPQIANINSSFLT